jgi:hypothetical protein
LSGVRADVEKKIWGLLTQENFSRGGGKVGSGWKSARKLNEDQFQNDHRDFCACAERENLWLNMFTIMDKAACLLG